METIYHLLWMKEFNEKFNHFSFFLPHTILIKNNTPITWYFSSKSGEVLRKKPQNLNNVSIITEFSKFKSKSSIAAMYLYEVNEDRTFCQQFHLLDKVDKDRTLSRRVMIEYISYEGLADFLKDEKKCPFGVLQKFVDPYGPKNFIIEALWTPKMTLFSKKVNVNNLYYDKLELIEKAATVDGNEIYSEVIQIKGPEISISLRESLTQVVRHIATVSFDHIAIKRMVCYLKIDQEQRVWLLWCGSCRVERENLDFLKNCKPKQIFQTTIKIHNKPLDLGTMIKNPEKHKRIYSLSLRNPAEVSRKENCPNCNGIFVKSEMVTCNYQTIVRKFKTLGENENTVNSNQKREDFYDKGENEKNLNNKNMEENVKNKIPHLIQKLHPELTLFEYMKLEKDAIFVQNLVEICLDCYMDLTRNLKISGPDPDVLFKFNRIELNPVPDINMTKPVTPNTGRSPKFNQNFEKNRRFSILSKLNNGSDALENEVNNALKIMLLEKNNLTKNRPVSSISWMSNYTRSTNVTSSHKKSKHTKNPSFY